MLKLQPNRHEIFHGAWLRSCEADGFAVSETVCASGVELTRHSHERAGFCAVLQGGFVEYRQGRERLYQQSDILFRPPGELHANRFQTTGGRCLNIEIADKQLTRMGAHARVFGRPADYVDQRLSQLIMRIYRELQQDDDVAALAIEALTLELLIEAARRAQPPVKQPKWLSKVEELCMKDSRSHFHSMKLPQPSMFIPLISFARSDASISKLSVITYVIFVSNLREHSFQIPLIQSQSSRSRRGFTINRISIALSSFTRE